MEHQDILQIHKLEMHYFLFDKKKHSINAFDLNKCEYHFLQIVKEVSDLLNLDIDVESEAIQEGGIKEIKRFLSHNKPHMISLFISLLANLMFYLYTEDKGLKALQKEELLLSIEKHRLELEKLKSEINSGNITYDTIKEAVEILSRDSSIQRQKSNYYKVIENNQNISSVSFTELADNNHLKGSFTVHQTDFHKYISTSDELPTVIDEDAKIEIISPVLKAQNYSWRGFYNGEPIYFRLKDKLFKQSVIDKKVTFANGFIIECVLQIKRKYNDQDKQELKYEVTTILDYFIDDTKVETTQGRAYRRIQEANKMQGSLFNLDEL